jgi:hypothetical protein
LVPRVQIVAEAQDRDAQDHNQRDPHRHRGDPDVVQVDAADIEVLQLLQAAGHA